MSSRKKDLAHVEEQIRALTSEAQEIQQSYQRYHAEVQASVKEILEKAGVWKEVHSLESERAEAGKRAEEKARNLTTRIQDLQKVRAFLLSREEAEVSEEKPEVPSKEEPVDPVWGEEEEAADTPPARRPMPPKL